MTAHLKESIGRLKDRLQAILSYLELEQYEKALEATKHTFKELTRLATGIADLCIRLPKEGFVVVLPHGTRPVSSDDVTECVDSDEVKVVPLSSVRPGRGKQNRVTK